jgi:hypothetical protein
LYRRSSADTSTKKLVAEDASVQAVKDVDDDLFNDPLDDLIGDIDSLPAVATNDDDLLLEMQELLS